jgi:hypothetical protein
MVAIASATAFFAVLSVETAVYYLSQHDFLFRLHETERNYEMTKSWFFTEGSGFGWKAGGYWSALGRRLFIDGPRAILFNDNLGFVTTASALSIGYAVINRVRTHVFLIAWFLSLVFMFNFGSSSLKTYQPIVLFDRYLYPVLLPAILLAAWFISFLLMPNQPAGLKRDRLFWGGVLATAILAASGLGIYHYMKEGVNSPVQRAVANLVNPHDTLYSDKQTPAVLNFLWGYPKITHFCNFRGLKSDQVPAGAYVLIDRKWAMFVSSHYGETLPEFFEHAPKSWATEWSGRDAVLYLVGPGSAKQHGSPNPGCAVNG